MKSFLRTMGMGGSEGIMDSLNSLVEGGAKFIHAIDNAMTYFNNTDNIFKAMDTINARTYLPGKFTEFKLAMKDMSEGINSFQWNSDTEFLNADKLNALTNFLEKTSTLQIDPARATKVKDSMKILAEGMEAIYATGESKRNFLGKEIDSPIKKLMNFDTILTNIVTNMEKMQRMNGAFDALNAIPTATSSVISPTFGTNSLSEINRQMIGSSQAAAMGELMNNRSTMSQIPNMLMNRIQNNNTNISSSSTIQVRTSVDRGLSTRDLMFAQ